MWHGPFRVRELYRIQAVQLEVWGTPYWLFPLVDISKLKRVKISPDRPENPWNVEKAGRLDFKEAMLPEDSWERTSDEDEFEVKKIMDVRFGKKNRFGRNQRQYLVQWKWSGDPTWTVEVDSKGGALLQEFDRDRVIKNCFEVMQAHKKEVE